MFCVPISPGKTLTGPRICDPYGTSPIIAGLQMGFSSDRFQTETLPENAHETRIVVESNTINDQEYDDHNEPVHSTSNSFVARCPNNRGQPCPLDLSRAPGC